MSEVSSHEPESVITEPDVLKSEHLAEGIRPIIACVGTYDDYREELDRIINLEQIGHHSDYHGSSTLMNDLGFKVDSADNGHPTYIISPIDGKPKFTKGLYDCSSLVAVGKNEMDADLSFLTHQDPKWFLERQNEHFTADLKERLKELKDRCKQGTIDIVVAGGHFNDGQGNGCDETCSANYKKSIETLDAVVKEIFGFSPAVACGPKGAKYDNAYFDTENRRLYIIREGHSSHNDSFRPVEIDKMMEKWASKKTNKK